MKGYELANMEYFILQIGSEIKSDIKLLIEKIQDSYSDFMGFKKNEKDLLCGSFGLINAPFINYEFY